MGCTIWCKHRITTDRGSRFESQLFTSLTSLLGAELIRTTAYHPEANGMIERWHRSFKAALMCHQPTSWVTCLPTVMLGLRTGNKSDLDASSAEILFGTTLTLPVLLEQFSRDYSQRAPTNSIPSLQNQTLLLERSRNIFAPYTDPYKVLKRLNNRSFIISIDNVPTTITTKRLRPAHIQTSTSSSTSDGPTTVRHDHTYAAQTEDFLNDASSWFFSPRPPPLRTYPPARRSVTFAPLGQSEGSTVVDSINCPLALNPVTVNSTCHSPDLSRL